MTHIRVLIFATLATACVCPGKTQAWHGSEHPQQTPGLSRVRRRQRRRLLPAAAAAAAEYDRVTKNTPTTPESGLRELANWRDEATL